MSCLLEKPSTSDGAKLLIKINTTKHFKNIKQKITFVDVKEPILHIFQGFGMKEGGHFCSPLLCCYHSSNVLPDGGSPFTLSSLCPVFPVRCEV